MGAPEEFRAALEEGDFRKLRRMSELEEPHLPRLSDLQAEAVMHDARTRAASVEFKKRAYSHRWLTERGLVSGLPDRLRPKAERVYPRIVSAVGIAVKARSEDSKAAALLVRGAMERAVLEAEADGKLDDPAFLRPRILEARAKELKSLFGTIGIRGGRNG